jgi:alpha-N-arabinofuranosidase
MHTACFLNECLRHCRTVGMANFAPLVNARGLIFTHDAGIVLRPGMPISP